MMAMSGFEFAQAETAGQYTGIGTGMQLTSQSLTKVLTAIMAMSGCDLA
jgi:hypothetical protein